MTFDACLLKNCIQLSPKLRLLHNYNNILHSMQTMAEKKEENIKSTPPK